MTTQRKPLPFGKRGAPLLLAGAVGAALLAGCGGGGGNGNTGGFGNSGTNGGTNSGTNSGGTNSGTNNGGGTADAAVIGKVVDTRGGGVPGANINVNTGGVSVTSLGQGGYRIVNLIGGQVYQITAAVTRQDGLIYTGSTQVLTASQQVISNANIIVSPQNQQATVGGVVTDSSGNPVVGIKVFLAVPNNANVSSLVAFTDANGRYAIANVPVNLPGGPVTVTASTAHAANQTATVSNLQAGGSYVQNFTLSGSTGLSLAAPTIGAVIASTEPTDSISARARMGHLAAGSAGGVYESLLRRLCPAYARLARGHRGLSKRRVAHALGGGYAIQTDVEFDTPNATGGSVLNYNVYLTAGTTPPQQMVGDIRDQVFDPQANYYTDLTFADDSTNVDPPFVPYAPSGQYNFAVSAVNTDGVETPLSSPFSVVPLDLLTLIQPTFSETLPTGDPTISWNPVANASRYYVFLYDQYPTAEVMPINESSSGPYPATQTSVILPLNLSPQPPYYVVVVAFNDQTEGTGASGQAVTITNAGASFSQITRFNVQ